MTPFLRVFGVLRKQASRMTIDPLCKCRSCRPLALQTQWDQALSPLSWSDFRKPLVQRPQSAHGGVTHFRRPRQTPLINPAFSLLRRSQAAAPRCWRQSPRRRVLCALHD